MKTEIDLEMKSIFELTSKTSRQIAYVTMRDMKFIIVKGVGYFVVGKGIKLTSELLLRLVESMKNQDIKEI